ncbi:MAG: Rab family GTPase [Candidatus Hodarchaeales archaeon]|jgi:small GTP-binding protein
MSYMLKILVAGDSMVGKTTLIQRYIANKFLTGIKNTIGVDFFLKQLTSTDIPILDSDEDLQAQIWDVSGEERFREILPLYSSGTQGLVLCFDNDEKLSNLWAWEEVLQQLVPGVPRLLVRTKIDLQIPVSQSKIDEFIQEHDILQFIETSAKEGTNVDEAFKNLATEIFSTQINRI